MDPQNPSEVFTQKETIWKRLEKYQIQRILLIGVVGFLCLNAIVLDIYSFTKKSSLPISSNLASPFAQNQPVACMQSCTDLINSKLISFASSPAAALFLSLPTPTPTVTPSLTPIPTITPTPLPTPTPTPTPTPLPRVKEFFIPLGAGFGSSMDWDVISGVGATIDLANYGQIDKIYFEVTVRIPNGNQTVNVRLYNANTYQTVENSDLTLASGIPTLLTSKAILLSAGSTLYQVQLKTQLGYTTYVDQARIRIITK